MANIDKSFNLNLDDDDIEITDEQLANDADFDIDDFDSLEDEESLNREETKEEAGKVKDEDSEIDEDSDDSSKHTVNNNFFKGLVAKEDDEELDDDIEDEDEDDSDISSDSKLSSIASIKDSNIFADNKQNIEDEEDEDEEDEDEDEADEDEDDEDNTHREKDPLDSAGLALDDTDTKEVDDTGTEVNLDEEGLSQKLDEKIVTDSDFIDSSGGIVVQDKDDDGHGFTFAYIDKDNIAVQTDSRIHKDASLTALQKSIQNTGILEPLVVAPLKTAGYYILIHSTDNTPELNFYSVILSIIFAVGLLFFVFGMVFSYHAVTKGCLNLFFPVTARFSGFLFLALLVLTPTLILVFAAISSEITRYM